MPRKRQPSATNTQPPPPRRAAHGLFAATLLGIAVLWGLRLVGYTQPSAADLFAPIAVWGVLARWAIADANARDKPIPMGSRVWFILIAPVVVPGYFIWTRGWRGVLWVALLAAGWYATCVASIFIGRLVAYGVGPGQ
jgi:hypothetical protein